MFQLARLESWIIRLSSQPPPVCVTLLQVRTHCLLIVFFSSHTFSHKWEQRYTRFLYQPLHLANSVIRNCSTNKAFVLSSMYYKVRKVLPLRTPNSYV